VSAELCPRPAPERDVVTPIRPAVAAARAPLAPSAPAADASAADDAPSSGPFALPSAGPGRAPPRATPPPTRSSDDAFIRMNATRASAPSQVEPLDRDLRRLHVTVSRRFLAKLDAARDALSHARPDATIEELLEAGLDLLLAERAKRRGEVKRPRPATAGNGVAAQRPSGAIPAHVRREVWKRAGGRCEFRLASGESCGSTTRLELDHVVPRALEGPSTVDNLRVCCGPHNDLAARQVFGDAWLDRFRRRTTGGPAAGP
jgi:hypothetical protein